ncbi:MAG: FHA domain-containing protein [Rhodoferax sp.]|nr:FHA domain-containing protein [Rhodoferax sp.]
MSSSTLSPPIPTQALRQPTWRRWMPAAPVAATCTARGLAQPVLRVAIAGGGPVGLSLALLLDRMLGERVSVQVYDHRWQQRGHTVAWKTEAEGNVRRQQVVTIQSRHYTALGEELERELFQPAWCSEMWPVGPDSVGGRNPVNIPIARLEDQLLALAARRPSRIQLVPDRFHPSQIAIGQADPPQVLAICEGARSEVSGTLSHFQHKFGTPDKAMYSHRGRHFQDVVLGLRVKSRLDDPSAVLLTVSQNRYLLNAVRGEGFLNMRLTETEAAMLAGFEGGAHIPPAAVPAPLWHRIQQGLQLFAVRPQDLSAIVMFRIGMVQRPRFSAELVHHSAAGHGTFGFLLGDTANAIHFWPGRGLNSGLSSAVSLACCLKEHWKGRPLRDADFLRHEAVMSMLQYRHKSRAWRHMVTTDEQGEPVAICEKIEQAIRADGLGWHDHAGTLQRLLDQLVRVRERLRTRLPGLPDDDRLREHLRGLDLCTLRVMSHSGAWDSAQTGGQEVDAAELHGQFGWA